MSFQTCSLVCALWRRRRPQRFTAFSLGIREIRAAAREDAWLLGDFAFACRSICFCKLHAVLGLRWSHTQAWWTSERFGLARHLCCSIDVELQDGVWLCCTIAIVIPRGVHECFARSERTRSPPLIVRLAACQGGTPPQVVLLLLGTASTFERQRALLCASSRLEACSTGAEHDRP